MGMKDGGNPVGKLDDLNQQIEQMKQECARLRELRKGRALPRTLRTISRCHFDHQRWLLCGLQPVHRRNAPIQHPRSGVTDPSLGTFPSYPT